MRPRQPRARRPLRHPVRLVRLAANGAPRMLDEETAGAYRVGLYGALLIYEYFPAFYQATNADAIVITLPRLLGCCAAFWQLVEQRGLTLRWPGDGMYEGLDQGELADTPEETLVMFDGVAEEWMSDLGYHLHTPRPCFYGYGVQALLDQETDAYPREPLTILLWHLFQQTPLGLGVPLGPMAANIDEDLAFDLFRIRPLPRDTPLHLLGAQLDLPIAKHYGVTALDLIRYAFGKTLNDLANHDDYEVEAIAMGEIDEGYDWSDLDRLVELQRGARQLADASIEWGERVTDLADLRRLAGQIHKAARSAARELAAPPATLITLLGYEHDEEAVAA